MKLCFHKPKYIPNILFISFLCILLITGCQSTASSSYSSTTTSHEIAQDNETFEQFLTDTFKQLVISDSISLHYSVKNPSIYGIEPIKPTFGDFSAKSIEENEKQIKLLKKQLLSFSKDTLSKRQQQDYDILSYYLNQSLEGNPYTYYQTVLSPVIGLQAQLPILLSEYRLETKTDIEEYLLLLSDLHRYFQEIFQFEQKKAELGLGMQDFAIEDIQSQCKDFIKATDTNCLITSFEHRLDALVSNGLLIEEEKNDYVKENKRKVLEEILPAYETLILNLDSLKGKSTIEGGICYLKNGKDYYKYLISTGIGSPLAPEEIRKQIEDQLKENRISLLSLLQQNPNILQEYEQASCPITEPQDILSTLQQEIEKDFPKPPNTSYELKTVDPSLSEHLSPAFYLTPPVDEVFSNVIYINSLSSSYNAQTLYPTLAHEGYPGHLYQNTYFYSTNPNPIRSLLNFSGYSEGWATYVEYHCYEDIDYGTSSSDIAKLQQYEMDLSLGICSLVDIGVNYDGWTLDECSVFLKENGIDDNKTILSLYYSVIEEPSNYLRYYSSFLQFENLRTLAKNELKENFNLKEFHKTILNLGPAPFPIVEQTIKEQLNIS